MTRRGVRGAKPLGQDVINFRDPTRGDLLTRDDPSAFAAPAQFGPFRVLHQIGVGALGPVFRTYEPERDRLVAVKVFRLDITPEQAQALADELSRSAEAGLFHPSIVEPIAAGVEGTVAYCAEEYVAAESLDVAMRHYAPAPIATVLPFITQLAGAIDFARAAGVGHGALHPRDIFVTPEEARATGFGVVEALERVGLRAPVRRPYSPPERIAGQAVGHARGRVLAGRDHLRAVDRPPARRARHAKSARSRRERPTPGWTRSTRCSRAPWMPTLRRAIRPRSAFAAALEAAGRGELAARAAASTRLRLAQGRRRRPSPCRDCRCRAAGQSTPRPADLPTRATSATRRHRPPSAKKTRPRTSCGPRKLRRRRPPRCSRISTATSPQKPKPIGSSADDFLLDAAGAASAVPEPPSVDTLRAADIAIDPAIDPPIDPRALEDDEVMVDDAPSPVFEPRDLLHETKAEHPRGVRRSRAVARIHTSRRGRRGAGTLGLAGGAAGDPRARG